MLRAIDFDDDAEWDALVAQVPLLELADARPEGVFWVDVDSPIDPDRPFRTVVRGELAPEVTRALGGQTLSEDLRRMGAFEELARAEDDRFLFAQLALVNLLRAKLTTAAVLDLPVFCNPAAWAALPPTARASWNAFLVTTTLALNREYDFRVVWLTADPAARAVRNPHLVVLDPSRASPAELAQLALSYAFPPIK